MQFLPSPREKEGPNLATSLLYSLLIRGGPLSRVVTSRVSKAVVAACNADFLSRWAFLIVLLMATIADTIPAIVPTISSPEMIS